jgi:DNA end-binding protein Ku
MITFGLVKIPVKLYSAAEEAGIDFDMLHRKDLSPIRYARICEATGDEVPYKDIVKGYQYEKGRYVVVGPDDFRRARPAKTQTVDVHSFVDVGTARAPGVDEVQDPPDRHARRAERGRAAASA